MEVQTRSHSARHRDGLVPAMGVCQPQLVGGLAIVPLCRGEPVDRGRLAGHCGQSLALPAHDAAFSPSRPGAGRRGDHTHLWRIARDGLQDSQVGARAGLSAGAGAPGDRRRFSLLSYY